MTDTGLTARVVELDDAPMVTPFGLQMRIMLRSEETGGKFSAIHAIHRPGEGPPPHLHREQQEYFLILQGTYRVQVGDAPPREVGPGTVIFIPERTVHTFTNVGATDAAMLDWSLPGGQEKYFEEIHALQAGPGFDMVKMAAVNQAHATDFVGH